MQGELPYAPAKRRDRYHHRSNPHPSKVGSGLSPHPVPANILSELTPVIDGFRAAALTQVRLKPLNPWSRFQSERRHITADNPFSEDPARQRAVLSSLQRVQMPHRDLRHVADRLNRDLASFPFPPKFVAESFHSLRQP